MRRRRRKRRRRTGGGANKNYGKTSKAWITAKPALIMASTTRPSNSPMPKASNADYGTTNAGVPSLSLSALDGTNIHTFFQHPQRVVLSNRPLVISGTQWLAAFLAGWSRREDMPQMIDDPTNGFLLSSHRIDRSRNHDHQSQCPSRLCMPKNSDQCCYH